MRSKRLLIGFLVVLLLATLFVYAENEGYQMQKLNALMSVTVEVKPERIPLNQDYLIVQQPQGEQHRVPVILVQRVYGFEALQMKEGKPRLWAHHLFSYEICANAGEDLFTWNINSLGRPLGMFRLFSNERGENYLTWVEGRSVCFSQIKEPRDRLVSVTETLAKRERFPGIVRVPTNTLIDRKDHYAKDRAANAFYTKFTVEALEIGESGTVNMKVSAPGSDKVFKLVFDGKSWSKE